MNRAFCAMHARTTRVLARIPSHTPRWSGVLVHRARFFSSSDVNTIEADSSLRDFLANVTQLSEVERGVVAFHQSVGSLNAAEWLCVLRAHVRLRALPNAAALLEKRETGALVVDAMTTNDMTALLAALPRTADNVSERVLCALTQHVTRVVEPTRRAALTAHLAAKAALAPTVSNIPAAIDARTACDAIRILLSAPDVSQVHIDAAERLYRALAADANADANVIDAACELLAVAHARLHNADACMQWLNCVRAPVTVHAYNAIFAALLQRSADALRAFENDGDNDENRAATQSNSRRAVSAFRVHREASRAALSHAHTFWRCMRHARQASGDVDAPVPDLRSYALILDLHVCAAEFDGAVQAADALVRATPPVTGAVQQSQLQQHDWNASLCALLLLGCSQRSALAAVDALVAVAAHVSVAVPASTYAALWRQLRADMRESAPSEMAAETGATMRLLNSDTEALTSQPARAALEHALSHAPSVLASVAQCDAAHARADWNEFCAMLHAFMQTSSMAASGAHAIALLALLLRMRTALHCTPALDLHLSSEQSAWLAHQCRALLDAPTTGELVTRADVLEVDEFLHSPLAPVPPPGGTVDAATASVTTNVELDAPRAAGGVFAALSARYTDAPLAAAIGGDAATLHAARPSPRTLRGRLVLPLRRVWQYFDSHSNAVVSASGTSILGFASVVLLFSAFYTAVHTSFFAFDWWRHGSALVDDGSGSGRRVVLAWPPRSIGDFFARVPQSPLAAMMMRTRETRAASDRAL